MDGEEGRDSFRQAIKPVDFVHFILRMIIFHTS